MQGAADRRTDAGDTVDPTEMEREALPREQ